LQLESSTSHTPDGCCICAVCCRSLHSSPALNWNNTIATTAQAYSSRCIFDHDPDNKVYGENLYIGASSNGIATSVALANAVTGWYNEVQYYDYTNPSTPTVANEMTGHFTQLVWKASTLMGCGITVCPQGVYNLDGTVFWNQPNVSYVVCRWVG
jgi:uncharacterized protein YkwD